MKRKVVQHGHSTLTVSLPADWIKKFNVSKGDDLHVEQYGKELRLRCEQENAPECRHIVLQNYKKIGKSYLTGLYRSGFDEISLIYDDPEYIKTIKDLVAKEITGFEIIKHDTNTCTVRDLTGHAKDEFDAALRRMWRLTISMSSICLLAIKNRDNSLLEQIQSNDANINKLSNYCLRHLRKRGYNEFNKTSVVYYMLTTLEHIADMYKDMYVHYLKDLVSIDKSTIDIYSQTNTYLNKIYNQFYKFEEKTLEDLYNKSQITHDKLISSNYSLSSYFAGVCNSIRNMLSIILEINL